MKKTQYLLVINTKPKKDLYKIYEKIHTFCNVTNVISFKGIYRINNITHITNKLCILVKLKY